MPVAVEARESKLQILGFAKAGLMSQTLDELCTSFDHDDVWTIGAI
jgi:hypothetical protein